MWDYNDPFCWHIVYVWRVDEGVREGVEYCKQDLCLPRVIFALLIAVRWGVKWCPVSRTTTPFAPYLWISMRSRLVIEFLNSLIYYYLIVAPATWLEYCRYVVNHTTINQSIVLVRQPTILPSLEFDETRLSLGSGMFTRSYICPLTIATKGLKQIGGEYFPV